MAAPFRVLFLVFIASFFGIGLYDVLTNFEENGCEMTYMYELPQYKRVPLRSKAVTDKFPKYSLYLYGEGKYARDTANLQLDGIPVLFLPGNAGSHKQVRSLGSVALRKAENMKTTFHFNYFSIDYNEELNGLFGGGLQAQTEFAHECIKTILKLYASSASPPKSVILVGHSMGGMIARGLFTLADFDPMLVSTIITQATPHRSPVINLDSYINDYYDKVNDYWFRHNATTLKHVVVIATGGGFRDILVRQDLTEIAGIMPLNRSLSTSTMSMPRAWVSTDHLCHVWCKQVVLATVRSMFDIIDRKTKQVARNAMYRMGAFVHHFTHNPGPMHHKPAYASTFQLDPSIKWEIRKKMSWKLFRDTLDTTRYSVVELPEPKASSSMSMGGATVHVGSIEDDQPPPEGEEDTKYEYAFTITSNIDNTEWLGACKMEAKDKKCVEVINLSPLANLIPTMSSGKKVLHIPSDILQTYSHLIVVLPKSKTRVEVVAELYKEADRYIDYTLPNIITYFNRSADAPPSEVVINRSAPQAVFYNITIRGLDIPAMAYTAHLVSTECKEQASGKYPGNVMKFHVPWSLDDSYGFTEFGKNGNMSLKLMSGKPNGFQKDPELHLYLHPGCTYHVALTRSWTETFGQFVRFYGLLIPTFLVIQIFMTLSWQLKQLDEEGLAVSFCAAHARWAQPWRVVPVAMIFRFMMSTPEEASLASRLGLPIDDIAIMSGKAIWAAPIPIFCYLTAYVFMEMYAYFAQCAICILARIVELICQRCCFSLTCIHVATGFEFVLLMAAAALSGTVCGTIGLVIVYFIYITKVMWAYMLGRSQHENLGDIAWNRFNINFSLLLLLQLTVVLNAPSLITWLQNFKYSPVLDEDPSRTIGVCVSVAVILLTYTDFPRPITELYGVSSGIFYISSVLMVIYAMESVYRVSYFIITNLLVIAIPLAILITVVKFTGPPPVPQVSAKQEEEEFTEEEIDLEENDNDLALKRGGKSDKGEVKEKGAEEKKNE